MRALLLSVYYQLLIFSRVKKALFFTFFFPIFIYVIFSVIWGYSDPEYSKFLLTGVIVMTVASDALFTIGNVILNYYQQGLVKFFRVLPYNFYRHILALITSRIVIIIIATIILILSSIFFFKSLFSFKEIGFIVLGVLSGFVIFALIGLIISTLSKDKSGDISSTNFIYFTMLFLSDTFYPLTELNPFLGKFIKLLPISPVLSLIRGDLSKTTLISIFVWIALLSTLFYFLFSKKQIKR